MASENKTKATEQSVEAFLERVTPDQRREDAKALCAMMARISGEQPTLWGPTMIGFGNHHYRYDSGREGDIFMVGFAPRKPALVLYVHGGFPGWSELMAKLGKHSMSKACIYVKRLADLDQDVLETLIAQSLGYKRQRRAA